MLPSRYICVDITNAHDLLFARLNIHLDEQDKVKDVNFG